MKNERKYYKMQVTVDTKFVFLLGDPVRQTFSNTMQNSCYETLGLDMAYVPLAVTKEGLGEMMKAAKVLNIAGYACTKPYKVEAMQYMDEVDELAQRIGSMNTMVLRDGKLIGYNTDGYGALRSIQEETGPVKGKTCFSFGAGGTGRSVCMELATAGVKKLYISSRSAMCEELCQQINTYFPGVCVPIRAAETEKVREALKDTDIILNLSGSGMAGHEGETPVDKSFLLPSHVCFDATYNPEKTQFLLDAESIGCKIINGIGMVLYQGVRQVALWTGREGDEVVEAMRKPLLEIAAKTRKK